jgi:glycosyltransferase involved in cell wall biosynthesis
MVEKRPIRILELRSVLGTGGGPEKTILLGAARTDRSRYAITLCYLRAARDPLFHADKRAAELALDYVEIRERRRIDWHVWTELRRIVRMRRIDIVHAHDYKTDLLAWMLASREPIVPIATAHGWTGHTVRERAVYYPCDRWLLARYPRVIAVSGEIGEELVRAGVRPENISVILNAVDPVAFRRSVESRPETRAAYQLDAADIAVGAAGRLEPQKRFDLLVRSFGAVTRQIPRARLLIAGEGGERERLARQIADAGLQRQVRLLGHVSDVRAFHHALDVFVQSSAYEGTPNAVLEAMALETPIVATDCGGTAEIARDGIDAMIVPAGDEPALTTALLAVIDDPTSAASRARSARRRVETELSFESRMQRVERLYDDLAGRLGNRERVGRVCVQP